MVEQPACPKCGSEKVELRSIDFKPKAIRQLGSTVSTLAAHASSAQASTRKWWCLGCNQTFETALPREGSPVTIAVSRPMDSN